MTPAPDLLQYSQPQATHEQALRLHRRPQHPPDSGAGRSPDRCLCWGRCPESLAPGAGAGMVWNHRPGLLEGGCGSCPAGPAAGRRPPLTCYNTLSSTNEPMTYAQITASELSASEARCAIFDLADDFSWETVAREMISRMSGDEAREFVEDFISLYAD